MKIYPHFASTILLSISSDINNTMNSGGRAIERIVKGRGKGPLTRFIGTVDIDGNGTEHDLPEVDPFILLDGATIEKDDFPPFGVHPHRGHSVVTILLQGKMSSWDSVFQQKEFIEGPASYWVDAGSGVFHDERSVIKEANDLPPKLYQLWIGVKEEDRSQPPKIQRDGQLPTFDCMDAESGTKVVGNGIYYVGEKTNIVTPHPITVAFIKQIAGSKYHFPMNPTHGGFIISTKGKATFGGKTSDDDDVLVLTNDADAADYLQIETTKEEDAQYLVCSGEKIGEKWVKKLVANGAIITANQQQAKDLAPKVETISKSGREGGSFAPFGK